mmetsp:Transcript_99595/g.138373  ORF Transcript_99595/g.138373 Transcript_99595/m.138373 type:complete len:88 (+) Transcript_99595:600-863(+)
MQSYALLKLPNADPAENQDEQTDVGVFQLAGKVLDRWKQMYNTQLGGTYVVEPGGKVLMEHRQEKVGDYVENSFILQALGIDPKSPS